MNIGFGYMLIKNKIVFNGHLTYSMFKKSFCNYEQFDIGLYLLILYMRLYTIYYEYMYVYVKV